MKKLLASFILGLSLLSAGTLSLAQAPAPADTIAAPVADAAAPAPVAAPAAEATPAVEAATKPVVDEAPVAAVAETKPAGVSLGDLIEE